MKKLVKRIVIVSIFIYILCIFINQQKTLNSYKSTQAYYHEQIEEQSEYQKKLEETKTNINSKEYIEKMAREKLDMYLPNETVYVDVEK
ncbi:MAG: septum formation initiator family protein [Clostridia bacterium]|nr:septum formation initiator family protein [Clostridia bacterium]